MSTAAVVAIVVAVLVVAAVVAAVTLKRGTGPGGARLKHRFGPEYERTLAHHDGDEKAARQELAERVKRYGELEFQPLSAQDREQFESRWAAVKAQFVDHPAEAVTEADRLIGQLAEKRGFPAADSPEHTDALSVHHPEQLQGYRRAHSLAGQTGARDSQGTEELRKALLEARGMFDELVGGDSGTAASTPAIDPPSSPTGTTTGTATGATSATSTPVADGRDEDVHEDQDGHDSTRRSPRGGRFASLTGGGAGKDDTDSTH
ncbi:hypothetical protein V2S66_01115 [Streptomyces sp. V4-01]|uniref:Secreted protein n=1 Tax=Actinacidiphila polyblastidii TaxID=3110430 RepID=A0ABU7P5L2_9ACTN|nr:hypothetical protein [Streptomyces sp. V4-01]